MKIHDGLLTALNASLVTWCGTAGPSSCSRPGRSWTGSPAAAGLVVLALALVQHHAAHLVVHVVGLPLVPGLEAPGVSAGPLPRALLEVVHPAQPVAVGVVTVHCSSTAVIYALHRTLRTCLQPAHDEVVLGLAGGLGQEPVVLHAALLGLVPATCRVSRVTCQVCTCHQLRYP